MLRTWVRALQTSACNANTELPISQTMGFQHDTRWELNLTRTFSLLVGDLEALGTSGWCTHTRDEGWSWLLASSIKTIFGNFSELGDGLELHLGTISQGNDHVSPLSNEPRHKLHILDDLVCEILAVIPGQSWHNGHSQICKPVAKKETSEDGRQGEWKPHECEPEHKIGHKVSKVRPTIKEHFFLLSRGPRTRRWRGCQCPYLLNLLARRKWAVPWRRRWNPW